MTAPLSPAQAEHLARIEAAEAAPESLRERVAEAIGEAWVVPLRWDQLMPSTQRECRRLADAAIAVICTPAADAPAGWNAEEAVRRVLALADELDQRGHENECIKDPLYSTPETYKLRAGAFYEAADRIRAAVAAPAAAADTQDGGR